MFCFVLLGGKQGLELVELALHSSTVFFDAPARVRGAGREPGEDVVGCV